MLEKAHHGTVDGRRKEGRLQRRRDVKYTDITKGALLTKELGVLYKEHYFLFNEKTGKHF